jgi:CRISPR-associated protein Csd1
MSWIAELHDLYEKNEYRAGIYDESGAILVPVFHTTVAAQITVTIDQDGNFLRAEAVPDQERLTIIPVTEKSASRTSGTEPHPLCDNLKYLAGNYSAYVEKKDYSQNYKLYLEQLEQWANSEYCHKKVQAIYRFIWKDILLEALIKYGVLVRDEAGRLPAQIKIQNISQTDAFIRFCVEDDSLPAADMLEDKSGRYFTECWKDRTLQDSYIAYCRSLPKTEEISYLTGKKMQISYLQPKKIRNEGDGAKLISANDEANYTFRGRFANKEEAFAIGYEDSQKAHNALKWMIRQQGCNYGGLYFVTWESGLNRVPDWQDSSDKIYMDAEAADLQEPDLEEPELEEPDLAPGEPDGIFVYTGAVEAARFNRAIRGYGKNLGDTSKTVIMAFDAATTGRLAILEYKEFNSSRYLQALQSWYDRCVWRHGKIHKGGGRYTFYGMVGIREAAELLYGTEQKGYFSLKGKEERYKDVAKRWMPCILEGREVPEDMVRLAVRRASSPVSFDSSFLWERILTLACSLVRQQYIKKYKEEWTMALDETCTKRDYLYGRLLALADRIEYRTYDREEGRETNAKRYMSAFSQHPYRTWKIIEEKTEPYLMRLAVPERLVYQKLLDAVHDRFTLKDYEDDAPLSGLYLLGFHNQSYDLRKKKEEEK